MIVNYDIEYFVLNICTFANLTKVETIVLTLGIITQSTSMLYIKLHQEYNVLFFILLNRTKKKII